MHPAYAQSYRAIEDRHWWFQGRRAIVQALCARFVAPRADLLLELAEEVKSDRLHVSVCDVTDLDALRAVIASMRQTGFIPDAMVLNAGGYLADITQEAFRFDVHRMSFATNVDAALFLVAEWLPDFLARKSGMFLVPKPDAAAGAIIKLFVKKSDAYFFPRFTTTLLRASLFVPDRFFRFCAGFLHTSRTR